VGERESWKVMRYKLHVGERVNRVDLTENLVEPALHDVC
jgi:hypothetical protein